jgi:hypothetical protein
LAGALTRPAHSVLAAKGRKFAWRFGRIGGSSGCLPFGHFRLLEFLARGAAAPTVDQRTSRALVGAAIAIAAPLEASEPIDLAAENDGPKGANRVLVVPCGGSAGPPVWRV